MAKQSKNPPVDEELKNGEGGGEAPAPTKKGGKLKLIIIVVLALVIGVGGGLVGAKFFLGGKEPAEVTAEGEAAKAEAPAEGEKKPAAEGEHKKPAGEGGEGEKLEGLDPAGPQNIEFKPFVVNLNDAAGKRFLKLTMSVEADTPELAAEINTKMAQFRDIILLLLSSLSYEDISTVDGKMRLRNQMLNRININLTSGKIKNIYFSEFVAQ